MLINKNSLPSFRKKSDSLGKKVLRTTTLVLAVSLASFSFTNSVFAQEESDALQVMRTPDGKLYIMTTDEQGKPVLQPLEAVTGTQKKPPVAVPSKEASGPVTVYVPNKAADQPATPSAPAVEAPGNNVQNFTFTEGSNVKITPSGNGVEVEVTPLSAAEKETLPKTTPAAPASEEKAAPSKAPEPLAVLPTVATKQGPKQEKPRETLWQNGGFGFGIAGKEYRILSEAAYAQGISDYAAALGMHLEYNIPNSSLYMGAGFNFIRYEDEDPFTVRTYRGFGRFSWEQSEAAAGSGYVEIGQRLGLLEDRVYIGLKVGYEEMSYSERYIDNCRGCYSEDIDIEAGAYVGGGIGFRLFDFADGAGLFLDLNYQEYLDEDTSLESSSSAQLTWVF